jgi:hypothetical protein
MWRSTVLEYRFIPVLLEEKAAGLASSFKVTFAMK